MRKANIFVRDILAGRLEETETGYRFTYDSNYLEQPDAEPVSLTLPIRKQPYDSNILHPFFDGLIPEGWLLDVALRNNDISQLDRMGLLLLCKVDSATATIEQVQDLTCSMDVPAFNVRITELEYQYLNHSMPSIGKWQMKTN
jgi:serine/threonine-protein kinase HipA